MPERLETTTNLREEIGASPLGLLARLAFIGIFITTFAWAANGFSQ